MPKIKGRERGKKEPALVRGLKQTTQKRGPIWEGPESDGPQGGITQGLLGRFLSCRERFRVLVVEGLKPADKFEPRIEYGNMWHVCEEALARDADRYEKVAVAMGGDKWDVPLQGYVQDLCTRYPLQRDEIGCWYAKCKALFPRYVQYWAQHPDVLNRIPLLQEQTFHVPYKLPSGRTVYLRGKWDGVDIIEEPRGVWLAEHKTKSTIDWIKIERQLSWDLQVMFYLAALWVRPVWEYPLKGVHYNCVRRPAHKTAESALEKFELDQRNGRVGEWFARWNVEVSTEDMARFRRESLDPLLGQLCLWWDWQQGKINYNEYSLCTHYRTPYYYDLISQGGSGEVDHYLATGSTVGLTRIDDLFPELKEAV